MAPGFKFTRQPGGAWRKTFGQATSCASAIPITFIFMVASAANAWMLALFYGGWEVALLVAVILILLGARNLLKGLGEGLDQFRKATRTISSELDEQTHDAAKSLGGIYGKVAAEALTHDNRTAEFYDPTVFQKSRRSKRMRLRVWVQLRRLIRRLVRKCLNIRTKDARLWSALW